jgi:predicted DNA-binding transcriptional regulator AlpA
MKNADKQIDYESLADDPASAPPTVPPPVPLQSPHQKQGDRGDDPDDAAALPVFVRYRDLVKARIVGNRVTLARLIDEDGFPTGFMLGRNTRVWALGDVEAWIASRPTARKEISDSVIEKAVAGRAAARAAKAETAEQQA